MEPDQKLGSGLKKKKEKDTTLAVIDIELLAKAICELTESDIEEIKMNIRMGDPLDEAMAAVFINQKIEPYYPPEKVAKKL